MRLQQRQLVGELMDDPQLDAERHAAALAGLARLNQAANSAGLVWQPIGAMLRRRAQRRVRILDVATGSGDIPVALARRAARAGIQATVAGADISARALQHAAARAHSAGLDIEWIELDVLHEPLPSDYDVLACSLFLHHLSSEQAVDLLARMVAAARQMVVVHDLRRSTAALWLTRLAVQLATRSNVVHVDGPRSVAAAFTSSEIRQLCARAGVGGIRLRRRWPFRFVLSWERQ